MYYLLSYYLCCYLLERDTMFKLLAILELFLGYYLLVEGIDPQPITVHPQSRETLMRLCQAANVSNCESRVDSCLGGDPRACIFDRHRRSVSDMSVDDVQKLCMSDAPDDLRKCFDIYRECRSSPAPICAHLFHGPR